MIGRVNCDGIGLAGVAVSNGHDVMRTDGQGRYELPRTAHTRFVFVTKPTGYTVGGPFYADVRRSDPSPSIDFELTVQDEPVPFTFGVIGDLHVADPFPDDPRNSLDTVVAALNWAVDDTQAHDGRFVISVGDVTHKARVAEYALLVLRRISQRNYHEGCSGRQRTSSTRRDGLWDSTQR